MYYLHTIRELREAYGWSREALAARLGLDARLVAAWEDGRAAPDAEQRAGLARLFLVPVEQLTAPDPARWPRG